MMKVRTLFIHPTKGLQDATVKDAPSVKDVIKALKEQGCKVLRAEEEEEEEK